MFKIQIRLLYRLSVRYQKNKSNSLQIEINLVILTFIYFVLNILFTSFINAQFYNQVYIYWIEIHNHAGHCYDHLHYLTYRCRGINGSVRVLFLQKGFHIFDVTRDLFSFEPIKRFSLVGPVKLAAFLGSNIS